MNTKRIALDNFRSGNYNLKIDQSFVLDIHTDRADESIVRTVLDIGKNLNLKLIAEGVKEQTQ